MNPASRIDPSSLSSLRRSLSGTLLTTGDDGYETARRIHNGMIDKYPSAIARCLGTADVVNALDLATRHGLEVTVRSGGHNVAGRAVCDGGMMVDLSAMKGSHVDPKARTIRVQAGLTSGEFNRETQLHGLGTTGGAVSSTGVAGLTLGGGFGFLMGKYGFTIDNLRSAELVTAKGKILHASNEKNGELFWGVRGGGGNFGVVTSFEFALHPVGPMVHGGSIAYPFSQSTELLRFYRELTSSPADDLTVAASLTHSPDGSGQKLAALLVCHCGAPAEAIGSLGSIKAFGTPAADRLGPIPYTALNQMLDASFPKLALNYWKSSFVPELTDDVMAVLVGQFAHCPSPMSKLILELFHGAAVRPKPSDTAFPHRDVGYSVLIIAQWRDAAENERNISWAKETFALLEPFTRRSVYSNYMGDDEGPTRVGLAYGENFVRLQKLKDRYDPDNLFRHNQNIPPSDWPKQHDLDRAKTGVLTEADR